MVAEEAANKIEEIEEEMTGQCLIEEEAEVMAAEATMTAPEFLMGCAEASLKQVVATSAIGASLTTLEVEETAAVSEQVDEVVAIMEARAIFQVDQ